GRLGTGALLTSCSSYAAFVTNSTITSRTRKINRKIPARILAMANDAPAIVVKPSSSAITPTTRNRSAALSIEFLRQHVQQNTGRSEVREVREVHGPDCATSHPTPPHPT